MLHSGREKKNGLPLRARRGEPQVKASRDEWSPVIKDAMRTLGWL
ncbi:hypothetical protein BSU04_12760 [Caballeronia sordidicola]|uniref:Uncharacterized protein n=1 Tax=Caballeronia sordidicola TaxID=196367 RepID=A0A226X5J1_CABSO|nr:hypothetical protein BSU04_12760 [Caballeronia sordidicola]